MNNLTIHYEDGIARVEVRGPFALAELVRAWRDVEARTPQGHRQKMLWDLRQAEWSGAAAEFELLNLRATAARNNLHKRVFAFLFASQSETAIAEVYLPDLQQVCIAAFFHYEPDATAWLRRNR